MFSFPNCFHFSIFSYLFLICCLYNNGVVYRFFFIYLLVYSVSIVF